MNIPQRILLYKSRHWYAIRCLEGVFYNLDSKKDEPIPFEDEAAVTAHLYKALGKGGELMLINTKQKAETE